SKVIIHYDLHLCYCNAKKCAKIWSNPNSFALAKGHGGDMACAYRACLLDISPFIN
ncbi:hypothetical protein ACJX0J_019138, partial [Zea mays]